MFRMPIGLYEKALPADLSWEARLAAAGQAGYDFIEISIDESDERLSRLDWNSAERSKLRQAIDNTGVKVMTMCLSGHRKYPLGSHDPTIREEGQEILAKAIEFGSDIGLRVVQIMGYDVFYEESDAETDKHFREGLYRGAQLASQAGMMLGLENMDTPYVDNLSKGLAIIKEINSPWLKLYPDMGNLAAAGYHPQDELRLAQNQILGIHVKDAKPKVIRGIPFEEGIVPFKEVFQTLAEIGFWGMLGVEIWGNRHAGQDPVAAATEAREFVESLVAAESWAPAQPFVIES
ncbi:MAG: L-ribulose-5-phosphate 3-epimerase [Anaerolineales bacterium]|nr:L-ribulose-5-phosphate 3-epimerase [Anaerolineales bacterium]